MNIRPKVLSSADLAKSGAADILKTAVEEQIKKNTTKKAVSLQDLKAAYSAADVFQKIGKTVK